MLDRILKAQQQMKETCEGLDRQICIMEVCGTHTVSIFRNGIRNTLPEGIKLLSGPGCPVCVTDQSYIDTALELADSGDVIIATYGDMIRVPGKGGSLETRQKGDNIRIVLSSDDALQLAKENPERQVVFLAVGFETTTPATAVAVKEAYEQKVSNFSVLCAHKVVIPAMKLLLAEKNHKIDAFLCPGHVSVITGFGVFEQIVTEFSRPCVVSGFEPLQIIECLAEICRQLSEKQPEVVSLYKAVVSREGNLRAKEIITECFEPADGYWRGLGKIGESSLKLKSKYSEFDAYKKFGLEERAGTDPKGCRCGEVLCGLIAPDHCELFGRACKPLSPIGPCMVSSEGACSAWYKYGRKSG